MRAPEFWTHDGFAARALAPLSALFERAALRRRAAAAPVRCPIPVICVGNLVVGGAGKTPVALALAKLAMAMGEKPHFVSRGYLGREMGPLRVDPQTHDFRGVGDEALLLARAAPAWVARDRAAGARSAAAAGASCIILDDGLQNLALVQDLALLVVDGAYGFGNGRLLPAGPLRERPESALPRLRGAIVLGEDRVGVAAQLQAHLPVLMARLLPVGLTEIWRGQRVVAFAGIGRPEKFFASLEAAGAELAARRSFADHHAFGTSDLRSLRDLARRQGAVLATTEKDWVRLPLEMRSEVRTLPVEVVWDAAGEATLRAWLGALTAGAP